MTCHLIDARNPRKDERDALLRIELFTRLLEAAIRKFWWGQK